MPKKKIALLGSTGSIGTQTLDICQAKPDLFECVAMAAGGNIDLLAKQILTFRPKIVSIRQESDRQRLEDTLLSHGLSRHKFPIIVSGDAGIIEVATFPEVETVVTGIVGCAGLLPTVRAIEAKKTIALANKETLIAGGPVVVPLLREKGVDMLPADSEHSAIFQCLQGLPKGSLRSVTLTASGGAFRDWAAADLHRVTVADALKHPNWAMGAKITVDSATMMNKGLEVIEAHYLFGVPYDKIDTVIHPQSIIHSYIETVDSSVIAQLGLPDMRLPLLYSLSWPHRVETDYDRLDLKKLQKLTFQEVDHKKYPCVALAYAAGRRGGSMTACLNAANERANELFRSEKLSFLGIPAVIEKVCSLHEGKGFVSHPSLQDIIEVDRWARLAVDEELTRLSSNLLYSNA
eukprot:scaffold77_cov243-Ochromonas_danica.AAC.5